MKKFLTIAASIGIFVVAGSVAYYLLVVSPNIAADQLEFERQKQTSLEAQKKAELKQRCEEMKADALSGDVPNIQRYAISQTDCDQ
ncbi:hypothetical protein [Streptomyces scabiei]|uniref:hypothetical protein n=1 Tax=Streptomyces scabiei TaxID=1930 RepID=UPI0029BF07E8|nr:hypothetical protein [Streptomyces scabiei]MDX3277310.1 hypothetical protein [Streptomyces scabiei]